VKLITFSLGFDLGLDLFSDDSHALSRENELTFMAHSQHPNDICENILDYACFSSLSMPGSQGKALEWSPAICTASAGLQVPPLSGDPICA
jgi:hypothetical protein